MRLKTLFAFMALFFVGGAAMLVLLLGRARIAVPDVSAYNDIACTLGEQWGHIDQTDLPGRQYQLDYAVLDRDGAVLAATRTGLPGVVTDAVRQRDPVLDIVSGGRVVGNVIIADRAADALSAARSRLIAAGVALLLLPLLFCAGYALWMRRALLVPFARMRAFAARVAEGDLDVPLEMDRAHLFGPFTESFDLMRTELRRARENERRADRSKKELVASLSHDIRTPVASIQAVSELMLARGVPDAQRGGWQTVLEKAGQIDRLAANLFHASLEELEELRVAPVEMESEALRRMIRMADYKQQAEIDPVPPCLVRADPLRVQQVFDNLFGNSYKYAAAPMRVLFSFHAGFLRAVVSDSGSGAPEESLPLLCNKFYRGENANGKAGSGLGLYLSRWLMERMGGELACANLYGEDGAVRSFSVRVDIPLAV